MTAAITGAAATATTANAPAPRPAASAALAMPTPIDGIHDALAMLYAATSSLENAQAGRAKLDVENEQARRTIAERDRQSALERAKKAANEGGLFKWLEKDMGLGGVVGLATFDYPLVAADLVAHETGLVENLRLDAGDAGALVLGSPEVLAADVGARKLAITPDAVKQRLDALGLGTSVPGISDADVKPVVEKAVMVNLMVVGGAASVLTAGGAAALVVASVGLACSAGALTSQLAGGPDWLSLGLGLAGAGCSAGAAFASQGAANAAARAAAAGLSGATTTADGADAAVNAIHRKASDEAMVDAAKAKLQLRALARALDDVIQGAKEGEESHARVTDTIRGAMETHEQTQLAASAWRA